uniref:DNA translocase FtsK 4TM domain-containing protein n=1 Tax=Roseomonas rosulenta TaxID=2748667 RepID=UPI001E2EF4E6
MPRAALSDESRMSTRSPGAAGRFASAGVRAVLRRRAMEALGLLVVLAAVALLVALATHNPADPSLNTATAGGTTNMAGRPGAIVSDILLQGFGFAATLPALALLAWAFRLVTHRGLGSPFARLGGLVAGMPLAAAALSVLPMPAEMPVTAGPGGAIGPLVSGALSDGLAALMGPAGLIAAQGLLAVAAVGAAFIACGLTVGEWRGAGRAAVGVAGHAAVGASQAAVGVARSGAAVLRRPDREDEDEPPAPARPGILARIASPFRRAGRSAGGLWRREPSVPLGTMLRAADEAAAAVPPSPTAPPAPLP